MSFLFNQISSNTGSSNFEQFTEFTLRVFLALGVFKLALIVYSVIPLTRASYNL